MQQAWLQNFGGLKSVPWYWYTDLLLLAFGLALALSSRERSGLRMGTIRERWRPVLLVCGGAVLATALVYPLLPTRPWGKAPVTMWLVSPLAQDLVFIGYLYGRLRRAFPGQVRAPLPVDHALFITLAFFGLWHLQNVGSLPLAYLLFQLFYTSGLAIIPALSRQWTGSVWYAVLCHSAINFIAWVAS